MEMLSDVIENNGAGYSVGDPRRVSRLVKRDGGIAMYLRGDGYYEVGRVRVVKAGEAEFGGRHVEFSAGERYWRNEDFGSLAICTRSSERAEEYYQSLVSTRAL